MKDIIYIAKEIRSSNVRKDLLYFLAGFLILLFLVFIFPIYQLYFELYDFAVDPFHCA
jgi:hypothetical protein